MMAAGCLLNTTQTSKTLTHLFRESEGITTVLSLLRNDYLLSSSMSPFTSPDFTPRFPSTSALSERSSGSFQSTSSIMDRGNAGETNSKKVITYLVGILMNICRLDGVCCKEVIQFRGTELLIGMIQLTQERLAIFCIECLKACCKCCEECKVGS